jgi:hypothetical protein
VKRVKSKILIIGNARHGKDTVAEYMKSFFGYEFKSSSLAASEIFIYNTLKDKYGYKTPVECFEDRVNHRSEWFDLICEFNKDDKARLAKEIMKSADIYVGMRSDEECQECLKQGVFDIVIGVFDPRKPLEDKSSFDIDLFMESHYLILNNGTLNELGSRVIQLENTLLF